MKKILPFKKLFTFIFLIFESIKCNIEPYVVGGEFAEINKYPHAVFLQINCGGVWICGSSILNQRILLTAAHCVDGCIDDESSIDAYAGHENLKKVTITRRVNKLIIHPKYSEDTVVNDISLVSLNDNLPLGDFIKRVIIKRHIPRNVQGIVAGWGVTNDVLRVQSIHLKFVPQKLRSKKTCSTVGVMHSGMMCAGNTNDVDARPSEGDSGSALITPDFQQIGLVSFRTNKLKALLVYTNVSYYYKWIHSASKMLIC